MKKFLNEIIILCIQLFMFYILPAFMYLVEPIAMVVLILFATFALSCIISIKSNNKIKYLYPFVIAILFLPTIYIYYNDSALVHSIWYFIVSIIGLVAGGMTKLIVKLLKKNINIKKIMAVILFFILIITIVCWKNDNKFIIGEKSNINTIENAISLSVKENTATKTGITLILKNDTNNEVIYSELYKIEIKKDNVWHKINVEIDFIEIAHILNSQDSDEIKIDWRNGYGELASGDYRIIKEVSTFKEDGTPNSFWVSAEFIIE